MSGLQGSSFFITDEKAEWPSTLGWVSLSQIRKVGCPSPKLVQEKKSHGPKFPSNSEKNQVTIARACYKEKKPQAFKGSIFNFIDEKSWASIAWRKNNVGHWRPKFLFHARGKPDDHHPKLMEEEKINHGPWRTKCSNDHHSSFLQEKINLKPWRLGFFSPRWKKSGDHHLSLLQEETINLGSWRPRCFFRGWNKLGDHTQTFYKQIKIPHFQGMGFFFINEKNWATIVRACYSQQKET